MGNSLVTFSNNRAEAWPSQCFAIITATIVHITPHLSSTPSLLSPALSLSLYSSCVGGTNSSFFLVNLSIHPGLFPGANFYAQARLCTGAGRLLVLLFNHPYPQLIVSVVQPLATVFPCNLTQISSHGHLHLSSPPDLYLPCSSRGAYRGTLLPFLC